MHSRNCVNEAALIQSRNQSGCSVQPFQDFCSWIFKSPSGLILGIRAEYRENGADVLKEKSVASMAALISRGIHQMPDARSIYADDSMRAATISARIISFIGQ